MILTFYEAMPSIIVAMKKTLMCLDGGFRKGRK